MPIICFATSAADVPAGVTATFIKDFQLGTDVWTWPTHAGLCISEREHNMHDDSDFYMLVWDAATQTAKEICFASTRGWTYPSLASRPDATPEVMAAYTAWRAEEVRLAFNAQERDRVANPDPQDMPFGTRVRLLKSSRKGCKTPYQAGEVGEVTGQYWFGTFYGNGYKTRNRFNGRLGLRMADGRKVFAAMTVVRLDREPITR